MRVGRGEIWRFHIVLNCQRQTLELLIKFAIFGGVASKYLKIFRDKSDENMLL